MIKIDFILINSRISEFILPEIDKTSFFWLSCVVN